MLWGGRPITDKDEETIIDTTENNNFDNKLSLAEQGDVLSQRALGDAYTTGLNSNYNFKKAIYWYTKAAEQGDGIAQYELASSYGKNFEDDIKSEYWYKKATKSLNSLRKAGCKDGRVYYCLAECLEEGYEIEEEEIDEESLFDESIPDLEDTAHKGNAISQFFLGDYYYYHEEDHEKSFYWYEKAAAQGHISAQCQIGEFFKDGIGVEKDIKQAIYWFTKAAEKGDDMSQFYLGLLYCYDNNEKNTQEAIYWLTKAAEQGNTVAQDTIEKLQKEPHYNADKEIESSRTEERKNTGCLWRIIVWCVLTVISAILGYLWIPQIGSAITAACVGGFLIFGIIFGDYDWEALNKKIDNL